MGSPIVTPNVGFQIPQFNSPNWNVPIVYDIELLDAIFGGEVEVPGLNVGTITGLATTLLNIFKAEQPTGALPGNTFTMSETPILVFGVFWNGLFRNPDGSQYSIAGNVLTTVFTPQFGDSLFVVYLYGS